MSATLDSGRREALKGIFALLLVADLADEDRWVHFIQVLNEAGRFIMGFPQLQSSESDMFGALDDIAGELAMTKAAIQQTTKEARIAQHELHKALEPLLPDESETGDAVSVSPQPAAQAPEVNPTRPLPKQPVQSQAEPVTVQSPVGRGVEPPPVSIEPQRPNAEDERFFTAIRKLGNDVTYEAVAEDVGTYTGKLYQRLSLLAKYDTLPADIAAWRAYRSTRRGAGALPSKDKNAAEEERVREAARDIERREDTLMSKNVAEMDDFMTRRKANASAKANVAWEARTKGNLA